MRGAWWGIWFLKIISETKIAILAKGFTRGRRTPQGLLACNSPRVEGSGRMVSRSFTRMARVLLISVLLLSVAVPSMSVEETTEVVEVYPPPNRSLPSKHSLIMHLCLPAILFSLQLNPGLFLGATIRDWDPLCAGTGPGWGLIFFAVSLCLCIYFSRLLDLLLSCSLSLALSLSLSQTHSTRDCIHFPAHDGSDGS